MAFRRLSSGGATTARPAIRSGLSTRTLNLKARVRPSRSPGVTLTQLIGRSVVWMSADGRTTIATARRVKKVGVPVTWLLRIPGHVWPVTPDMPSARIWRDGSPIPVKGFPTWQDCDREVARVLAERSAA